MIGISFVLVLVAWCQSGLAATSIQQQPQPHLWLDCSCMHLRSVERNASSYGNVAFNGSMARGAKNNCYMIFIMSNNDEIVAFRLRQLQLRAGCLDIVEVFPYLREPVIENTTLAEYVWCNRTDATTNHSAGMDVSATNDEFIYSSGKVLGLRLTFRQPLPPSATRKIDNWQLNITADYRFLKRDNFKTNGRLIPGTYCDYYFFANTDEKTTQELDIWRYFHSPRFPARYPAHIKCAYKFLGRPTSRVEIVFDELQLPRLQSDCNLDSLTVFDAESAHMNAVIDVLCEQVPTRHIISAGPDLLIEFNASSNVTAKGFRGKYKFLQNEIIDAYSGNTNNPPTEAVLKAAVMDNSTAKQKELDANDEYEGITKSGETPTAECKLTFNSRLNKSGTFETSKLFFDDHNGGANTLTAAKSNNGGRIKCRYEFHGLEHEHVQIKFHDFSIPAESSNSSNCKLTDSLQILSQVGGKFEAVEHICGVFLPKPIMSTGPKLTLQFTGKYPLATNKVLYYGFRAEFKFLTNFGITSGKQLSDNCTFVYNSTIRKSGAFYSPNFPGFYLENLICSFLFYGESNEKVVVRFEYFDVEGVGTCEHLTASDYVEFSNFMTTDRKYPRFCGKLESFDVQSDGRFFRITFSSNDRFVAQGFRAFYDFQILRSPVDVEQNASMQSHYRASVASPLKLSSACVLILVVVFKSIFS